MAAMNRFALTAWLLSAVFLVSGCDWFVSADQRVERARAQIADGRDGAAIIELKKAVKSEPGHQAARLLLADVSLRLGDWRSAEKELESVTASGDSAAVIDRIAAEILLARGEFAELLERSGTLRIPEWEQSTYRGHALRALRKMEKASDAYREAITLKEDWAPAHIGLAEVLTAQGRSDEALSQLHRVIEIDKENALAWFARGTIAARRGDVEVGEESFQRAKDFAPGQLSAVQYNLVLAGLTESQLGAGKVEAARQTLSELIARTAATPLTQLLTARLAMAEQNYTLAVAEAQKVISAAPDLPQARLLLGAALIAQGNWNQAASHLGALVAASPENYEARKLLAQVNIKLQRPDAAAQILAPMQGLENEDAQLGALMGLVNLQQGHSETAIQLLEKSVAAQPKNAALKLDLAMVYLRTNQAEHAVRLLKSIPSSADDARRDVLLVAAVAADKGAIPAAQEIDRFVAEHPKNVRALTTAAELHARFGNIRRARELLDDALAIEPGNRQTLIVLAEIAADARDYSAAHAALDTALKQDPTDTQVRFARAQLAMLQSDEASAIAELEQVRKLDPKAPNALLLLAQAYARTNRFDDAEKVIEEALRIVDVAAPVHGHAAQMYMDAGRYEQALARFRQAIAAAPTEPTYYIGAARAQLATGDLDSAEESIQRAMKAKPDYMPAVAMAIMLDLRRGRRDGAAARIKDLKNKNPNDPSVSLLEGDVLLASKDFRQAAAAYARSNKLAPSARAALREYRARVLGDLQDPTVPLSDWLARRPDDLTVRLVLAEDLAARGDTRRAIEHYETLAKAPQPNAMALNNLAWLYHEAGNAQAAAIAEQAYEIAPQVPAIGDTLGWILLQSGDKSRGLTILKAAATADSNPEIRYHYAVALSETGDRDAALRELQSIVKDAAGTPAAAKATEMLSQVGG